VPEATDASNHILVQVKGVQLHKRVQALDTVDQILVQVPERKIIIEPQKLVQVS
jgi:hypothetical protein